MTEKKEKAEEKGEQWIENVDKMQKLSKSVAEAAKELCCRILKYEKKRYLLRIFFLLFPKERHIQYNHSMIIFNYYLSVNLLSLSDYYYKES